MGLNLKLSTRFSGKSGEEAAALYLKKKHYKILEQNYRCRRGEIDIVARHGKILVFVEVKKRKDESFQRPAESVTAAKQRKIVYTAKYYLSEKNMENFQCRFDVVEVLGDDTINHIENAFLSGTSF